MYLEGVVEKTDTDSEKSEPFILFINGSWMTERP